MNNCKESIDLEKLIKRTFFQWCSVVVEPYDNRSTTEMLHKKNISSSNSIVIIKLKIFTTNKKNEKWKIKK